MITAITQDARAVSIARLNDRCRLGLDRTSKTVITRACLATFSDGTLVSQIVAPAGILGAIRKYHFPIGGKSPRDRGEVVFHDTAIYFVIDAYNIDLTCGSEDPADASITRRVMTIMLREDL